MEKGEQDAALQIYYDKILKQLTKSDSYLDIVDGISLLYRLKLGGSNFTERWSELKSLIIKHIGDNGFLFNDMHIFMCISSCSDSDAKSNFLNEFKKYLNESNNSYLKNIKIKLGTNILDAISHFDQNEFS